MRRKGDWMPWLLAALMFVQTMTLAFLFTVNTFMLWKFGTFINGLEEAFKVPESLGF